MHKLSLMLSMTFALLLGMASIGQAATITENIGTIDSSNPSASFGYDAVTAPNFKLNNAGTGTFDIYFTIGSVSNEVAASLTASAVGATAALKTFTLSLYSLVDGVKTLLASIDETSATYASATTQATLDFAGLLKSGDYLLELIVTSGKANQKINGNIDISAVPLPASLPMFGAVLIGLSVFQFRRRRATI